MLASTLDEYSQLLCYLFSPIPDCCDQMTDPRSLATPLMTTTSTPTEPTTMWRPSSTRSS